MQPERPSLKEKKFSSLLRSRKANNVPSGGVKPINTLTTPKQNPEDNQQESLKEEVHHTLNQRRIPERTPSPKNSLDLKFERNKEIRGRLSGLNNNQHHKIQPISPSHPLINLSYTLQVNDCCDLPINIRMNNLLEPPLVAIALKSFSFNGPKIRNNGKNSFVLQVSSNNKFLYITKDGRVVDRFVVHRDSQLKSLVFSDESILIELKQDKGLIVATHYGRDEQFRQFFNTHPEWNVDASKTVKNIDLILTRLRQAEKSKSISPTRHSMFEPLDNIKKISPTRITRSSTRQLEGTESSPVTTDLASAFTSKLNGIFQDDDFREYETPASFSPDLNYKFPDNKTFRITATDFKTLYNNDWINDTVIDFFIQYEIHEALKNNPNLNPKDIYAFNSFFFTKLTQKNGNPTEAANYYDNIKRWLSKIPLMEYPYVIMPINEHAHWYGCIIQGLPDLLKVAKEEKEAEELLQPEDEEKNSDSDISEHTPEHKRKYHCEIFVFDSLSHKHANIKVPLKRFIIDYCQDMYNVNIRKNQIRIVNARVPKQNNFNDCGIHVIYNIRKWINNISECEKIWRSSNSNTQILLSKSLFLSEERNGMRKQLINILLDLQGKQEQHTDVQHKDVQHEDEDDVIFIEHRSAQGNNQETNKIEYKTLDPRAKSTTPTGKFLNSELNLRYGDRNIPELGITTLNELIPVQISALPITVTQNVQLFIDTLAKTEPEKQNQLVEEFKNSFIRYKSKHKPKESDTLTTLEVSKLKIESDVSMENLNSDKESETESQHYLTLVKSRDSDDVLLVDDSFTSQDKPFLTEQVNTDKLSKNGKSEVHERIKQPNEVIQESKRKAANKEAQNESEKTDNIESINTIHPTKGRRSIDSMDVDPKVEPKGCINQKTEHSPGNKVSGTNHIFGSSLPMNNKIKVNIYESKLSKENQKEVTSRNEISIPRILTHTTSLSKNQEINKPDKIPKDSPSPLTIFSSKSTVDPWPGTEPIVLTSNRVEPSIHITKPISPCSRDEPLVLSPRTSSDEAPASTAPQSSHYIDDVIMTNTKDICDKNSIDLEIYLEEDNTSQPLTNLGKYPLSLKSKTFRKDDGEDANQSRTDSEEEPVQNSIQERKPLCDVNTNEPVISRTNSIEEARPSTTELSQTSDSIMEVKPPVQIHSKDTDENNIAIDKLHYSRRISPKILGSDDLTVVQVNEASITRPSQDKPKLDANETSKLSPIDLDDDESNATDEGKSRLISNSRESFTELEGETIIIEPDSDVELPKGGSLHTSRTRTRSKGSKLFMLDTWSNNIVEISTTKKHNSKPRKDPENDELSITKQVIYLDNDDNITKRKPQQSGSKRRKLN